jgi:Sigma-54 interaction domain/FHA domain
MAGPAITCADQSTSGPEPDALHWCVTLVHSTDPGAIGRRRRLEPGQPLELGRGALAFGVGALDDERISRAHLCLRLDERVQLEDLASHNGSFVDGRRVERAVLDAGALVGLGRTLVLLQRGPAELPAAPPIPGLVGCGSAHTKLCEAIDKIAARSTPVLLTGPTGAGKSQLAEAIHLHGGRAGPLHVVHCGVPASEAQLDPLEAGEPGSTLLLDNVGEASAALQARLLVLLDRDRDHAPRIVAASRQPLTRASAGGSVRDELAIRLERWLVHVPALLARREDITLLSQSFAERHAGEARALHPKLALALMLHDWPGNLHELEAVIECACIDAEPGRALPLSPPVRARLERGAALPVELPAEARPCLQVAADGSWFGLVGQARVDIAHRKPLTRLVRALAEARLAHPGQPLGPCELLALGWPDEQIVERAGANRVYVALTTLRKLGLRELLRRDEHGYLLAPELQLDLKPI